MTSPPVEGGHPMTPRYITCALCGHQVPTAVVDGRRHFTCTCGMQIVVPADRGRIVGRFMIAMAFLGLLALLGAMVTTIHNWR